eukprot:2079372-Lingulodinium_polyedra.AAC.1
MRSTTACAKNADATSKASSRAMIACALDGGAIFSRSVRAATESPRTLSETMRLCQTLAQARKATR